MPERDLKLKLRARVYEGAIGLGLLTPQRNEYQREVHVVANEESEVVDIQLPGGAAFGALMLRNTSIRGRSSVDLEILGCEPSSFEQLATRPEEILVDPAIFACYTPWSGWVPSGYFTDWTGILTRASVWTFSPEVLAKYNRERHEDHAVPIDNEHLLDWAPLALAIKDCAGTFRMAALGAGWGRWLAAGAALASQTGRDYRLLGVEAEPQHFEWMLQHFRENKIPESHYIALNAAAVGTPGDCWFAVGNSQAWYGQAICSENHMPPADGTEVRRTRGVTLDEVLSRLSPLDYLHMDVQGAELDVLSYRTDRLARETRLVNIGTHSAEIEVGLRKLFGALGWECLYDVKLGAKHSIRIGSALVTDVNFGDGVQVWRNPRLRGGQ